MKPRDAAELVRLPAALTVPGDSLAGAAAARWPYGGRTWAAPAASVCLYLAGMALNDFADADLDAVERPERPIPSGRVDAFEALGLAAALTGAGLTLSAVAGGKRALRVAIPLTATIWTYDLWAQRTAAGPAVMALARGLDVLLGAGGDPRRAALPALAIAAHTAGVTTLSRGEVHGATPATATAALAATGTAAAATATATALAGPRRRSRDRWAVAASLAGYAATVGRAQLAALRTPGDAGTVRAATGTGVRGVTGLQSALLAAAGAPVVAGALTALGGLARIASRKVSPT
ncbi:SCO3242 family prenyltransferase [Streptomyces xiamenensis]|uniref:UbiA, prenyltransferase family protein n=1 Tax=Streptomyces xiamenensis TaxID=408015 RepID=A0A0F7FU10_9ACTN|nr:MULTISPECIES: UbiA family prenyltransferase [Streptomyces]AKG43908.1 ubiA, prenyltransferase family protein [Streptomyces xiamenensis]